jgi:hypothetical protein
MQFVMSVSRAEFEKLWDQAILAGYMRVDPKRAWRVSEMKDAVRWYIAKLAGRQ